MTTDSSMRFKSGLNLNDVTKPAPGEVPSLRGILLRSRCHNFYVVYDIKKFFCSVFTSDKDSYLRIVCVPATSFSSPPPSNPSWIFYCNKAIPFGDSASGDYAPCAKVATNLAYIQDSPVSLQPPILQAILEDTYIDDGGVGASFYSDIKLLQGEIEKILSKGGFSIKSWECSGEDGRSKYLGMTWDSETTMKKKSILKSLSDIKLPSGESDSLYLALSGPRNHQPSSFRLLQEAGSSPQD